MGKTDVLVIGGSAGGISAAISARRNYPDKSITIIRKEKQVLIPCGIPYILGTIGSIEKDLIPDTILSENNINLILDEVIGLTPDKKMVKTLQGEEISYEKLILAIGSIPAIPPIPGANLENVFTVKKDAEYLKNMLKILENSKKVVIIGGGFVGVEFADDLRKKGIDVTIVEMLPHCLQLAFDEEFCIKAEEKLKEIGVKIFTNNTVEEIEGDKKVSYVKLKSGEKLDADAVIIAVGIKPNVELAKKAGLKIGSTGGIWVDEYQRTSNKDVFAVGDCAEKASFFTKKPTALKLASIATREGRIAGSNLFELRQKNEGVIGTFSTIVRDLAFGVSGMIEKVAKDAKIDFLKGEFKTVDKHPGAMPNSKEIYLKLLFSKSGEIIGGEMYGGLAIAEVTNIVAVLIEKKSKIDEIVKLQVGTHPALTSSPITYPIVNAAEIVMSKV